jgi:hypothetical protein
MNKILIVVGVLLVIILIFNIVSLSGINKGWFKRSTTQPAPKGLDGDKSYVVAINYNYGTLGYCSREYDGTNNGKKTDRGCHRYKDLVTDRGDLPSDSALRGVIRGGRVGLAFSVLALVAVLGALICCGLIIFNIVATSMIAFLGVLLTVLNLIFTILAWSVMLGMHRNASLGQIECGLSDANADYAWALALVASILALIAAPLFLIGAVLFGGAKGDGDTNDMLTYQRPPDEGVPYTLMASETGQGVPLKQM